MNLIELAKEQLTPEVIGRLSGLIGEGEGKTRTAAVAAVPALLSALSGVASSPGGAQKLTSALDSLDLGAVSNIGKALTGGDTGSLLQMGTGLLGTLFGGGMQSGIVDALAKFAGLGPGPAKNLLGYLLPLVLGVIAGQGKGRGQGAQGLVSMLADQRQNIANALPAGLSLRDVPGLDVSRPTLRATAGPTPVTAPNPMKWLLPLVALGALALLLWWGFGRQSPAPPADRALEPTAKRAELPAGPDAAASVPDVNVLGKNLSRIVTSLTESLTDVRDEASAEAALPKLGELDKKLDGLKTVRNELPEADKATFATLVTPHLGTLKDLITKVLAIPGVSEKLKPVLDGIMAKLTALGA
jgi:hypothetical protein